MPTAAVVIIGNEILTGKFADENGPYAIRRLRELGCDLVRLVVIRDTVQDIADEVARCAAQADLVITTGGVGPTHDDVTLEGIAAAFGLRLQLNDSVLARFDELGITVDAAFRRMATLPIGSQLIEGPGLSFPVLLVQNVYVFPGVPKMFREKFDAIADRFSGVTVSTARVHTDQRETEIAATLSAAQAAFPTVEIGSYPRYGDVPFRVIVTLESRDREALEQARRELASQLRTIEPVDES